MGKKLFQMMMVRVKLRLAQWTELNSMCFHVLAHMVCENEAYMCTRAAMLPLSTLQIYVALLLLSECLESSSTPFSRPRCKHTCRFHSCSCCAVASIVQQSLVALIQGLVGNGVAEWDRTVVV